VAGKTMAMVVPGRVAAGFSFSDNGLRGSGGASFLWWLALLYMLISSIYRLG
jgi:hypothetical protein